MPEGFPFSTFLNEFSGLDENHTEECIIFIQSAFGRVKFLCSQDILPYICIINQRHHNMNMILHNFKVAFRNLMKYKLQTAISVLSIAVGIVTLSFTHSLLSRFQLPSIYKESYYDRAYKVTFKSENETENVNIRKDLIRMIKSNGGLRCAERIAVPNGWQGNVPVEFHLSDSTIHKGAVIGAYIDPEYPNYSGLRSAITGKKIRKLKSGEGIVSDDFAKKHFHDKNPIGAVQTSIVYGWQPIQITIVDVYNVSIDDYPFESDKYIFCVGDNIEDDNEVDGHFFAKWINVVLRDDCTKKSLLNEINEKVKPLGLKAELSKVANDSEIKMIITIQFLGYIIGSLILLAGIIGFLRIQIQLFRIRSRELALRIVNGASNIKLFWMLLTEIIICISLAIVIALILGNMLQEFCDNNLDLFVFRTGIRIQNLWQYSIAIGVLLVAICSLIGWITLRRIVKSEQGLSANLRISRNHLFRNVMLGIQIIVCMVFVCSTFILVNGGDKIFKACNVPDNDDFYKDCLYLEIMNANERERLLEELKRLPDLDKMVMINKGYFPIKEIMDNPEMQNNFLNRGNFNVYCTQDTSLISLLGMEVEWFHPANQRDRCLLISKELYKRFQELGLLDSNALTIMQGWVEQQTLPITGIIKKIPYNTDDESLVAISPEWKDAISDWLLVPKKGKSKALAKSVDETIERIESEAINNIVFNFRENMNQIPGFVEAVKTGGWILGCVSLLICVMSIFSTIALDTRARRKEIAVRKVNGAKSRDIYRMFGKVYLIMIGISLFIAVPICILFNQVIESMLVELSPESTLSPLWPIILGVAIVILLIAAIVGWQIHKVVQVNPAKIIAKE